MSQENVELVRRGHEAFRNSGEEAIFEYLHADIDLTPVEELFDGETFHGHDGVRRFFQSMREAFGDFGRGPLTIDSGWREVAQTALDFVKRFA